MIERKLTYLEFAEYCEQIKEILKTNFRYEEKKYYQEESDFEYKRRDLSELPLRLFLANGECLNISIPKSAVPHLLGINTEYLKDNGFVKAQNAYDALIEIIEYPDRLKNRYKIDDYSKVASPYIEKKLRAFVDNILIDINNCEFVCKFDSNRAYGYNNDEDMDYFIVSKVDNGNGGFRYDVLILKKTEDKYTDKVKYVPQSNQSFDSKEEFIEVFLDKIYNQELTLLIKKQFKTKRYDNFISHWILDRRTKLFDLEKWCEVFSCIPNVLRDFAYSLKLLSNEKDKNTSTNSYIDSIIDDVRKGKYIKINYRLLSQELIDFLEAHNDGLNKNDNEENSETYSKLLKRKNNLEEMLNQVSEEKERSNAELFEIRKKYEDALKENSMLKEKIIKAKDILS